MNCVLCSSVIEDTTEVLIVAGCRACMECFRATEDGTQGGEAYVWLSCEGNLLTNTNGDAVDCLLIEWPTFGDTVASVMESERGPVAFTAEVIYLTESKRDRFCEHYDFFWE